MCKGQCRNLQRLIEEMTPVLGGWIIYYRLAEVKGIFEELDGWKGRKLRVIIWRQWKQPNTGGKALIKRGLPPKQRGNLRGTGVVPSGAPGRAT